MIIHDQVHEFVIDHIPAQGQDLDVDRGQDPGVVQSPDPGIVLGLDPDAVLGPDLETGMQAIDETRGHMQNVTGVSVKITTTEYYIYPKH